MKLRVIVEYDDAVNAWSIYCPDLPGITSCGTTETEALKNFREAAELFFEPSDVSAPSNSNVLEMIF